MQNLSIFEIHIHQSQFFSNQYVFLNTQARVRMVRVKKKKKVKNGSICDSSKMTKKKKDDFVNDSEYKKKRM